MYCDFNAKLVTNKELCGVVPPSCTIGGIDCILVYIGGAIIVGGAILIVALKRKKKKR
jgi:hypothetical protein